MKTTLQIMLTLFTVLFFFGCSNHHHQDSEIEHGSWLRGDKQHFVETVEEQFGGFSTTMREVAYRFEELYWAGLDGNWEYADYQLEHIEEAIEAGIIRRPDRTLNAELFLKADQPRMQLIVDNKDAGGFAEGFAAYRQACVACHMREDVRFIPVNLPKIRQGVTWSD
jgi:hypothetical protein